MAFKDYFELDDVKLELPIGGKLYLIPPIVDGRRYNEIFNPAEDVPKSERASNEDQLRFLLGDTLDEMRADFLPVAAINLAASIAVVDHDNGRAVAEAYWAIQDDAKAAEYLATLAGAGEGQGEESDAERIGLTESEARAVADREFTLPEPDPAEVEAAAEPPTKPAKAAAKPRKATKPKAA